MRRKSKKELYGGIAERLYVDSGIDLPEIREHYLPHVSLKNLELWRAEGKWRDRVKRKALSAGEMTANIEEIMLELSKKGTPGSADAIQKLHKVREAYRSVSDSHFPERAVEVFERFMAFIREREPKPGKRQEIFAVVREFLGGLE